MKVGESGVQSQPQLQSKHEASLGYKDPVSEKKISKQIDKLINIPNKFHSKPSTKSSVINMPAGNIHDHPMQTKNEALPLVITNHRRSSEQ